MSTAPTNTEARQEAQSVLTQAMQLAECGDGTATARGERIAELLTLLNADGEIIAAARLFPLLESGDLAARDVDKRLGPQMARLCRELVKLSRFGLAKGWEPGQQLGVSQADALRKMLLAIADDVRLVLVRIADQLCRLQTAKNATPEERRHLAIETRDVFAPLANRLGIWQLKWEMEDLVFRFLEPDMYKRIAGWLAERRVDREDYIQRVIATIDESLRDDGIDAQIKGRPKHIFSIYKKMQRKNVGFAHVYDVRAIRVLVETVAQCYAVLGAIHGRWPHIPGEFDDYIATPKGNNYQSLHTAVVGPEKKTLEIQIRTFEMDAHAELGVAAHWQYKEGGGKADESFLKKINWLRSILEPNDDGEAQTDLIDQMQSEAFEDRVYVLTPGGDIVDLPQGATPLDFAYHVHTDIGHRCRGAKVGGKMVPLTHELSNGDSVSIITAKQAQPSRDWLIPQLGYLKSSRARAKARAWFRRQDREHNATQGQALYEKEVQSLGVDTPHVTELAKDFGYQSATDLYVALGFGDVSSVDLVRAIEKRVAPPERPPLLAPTRRSRREPAGDSSDVRIEGVGDLLTVVAKCCQPVPPDAIIGYITQGRGVTVHREDCSNVNRLRATSPERLLNVDWAGQSQQRYPVDIVIEAYDRPGLLKDLSTMLSVERVNILSVNTLTDPSTLEARMNLTLEIDGLEELSRVLQRIGQLPNVLAVSRKSER
ncbi:MAG: bifunctional (p)ppGpp synthetase/guanosine-3',5'-bis(diphosphate) 3'-pyrophosphohydrolase [Gammaproteobacteria bacterium]